MKKKHHHKHHPSDKLTDCGSKKHLDCKPTLIGDYFEQLTEIEKKFICTVKNKATHLNEEGTAIVHREMEALQTQITRMEEEIEAINHLVLNMDQQDNIEELLNQKQKSLKSILRKISRKRPEPIDHKAVKAFLKSHKCSQQRWEKHQHDIEQAISIEKS